MLMDTPWCQHDSTASSVGSAGWRLWYYAYLAYRYNSIRYAEITAIDYNHVAGSLVFITGS